MDTIRLLTFQTRELLFEALENGVAYAKYRLSSHRVKKIHQDIEFEDDEDGDIRPLYTYAYCYNYGVPNIDFVARTWANLMGYMRFGYVAGCFIELEVPLDKIILFGKHHTWEDDSVMSYEEVERYIYGGEDLGDDIEALIPYLDREWIVSYTLYENRGYGKQVLSPNILKEDKFPMYTSPIGISGEGYYLNPETFEEYRFNDNIYIKNNECDKRVQYNNAIMYLLSNEGIINMWDELFEVYPCNWEVRKKFNGYTLNDLYNLKEMYGRKLTEQDF